MTVLRRAIELSSSFDDGPRSARLSIRQLVPVQESLLRAVAASVRAKEEEEGSSGSGGELTATSFSTISCSFNLSTITEHEEYDDGHSWPDESCSADSTTAHHHHHQYPHPAAEHHPHHHAHAHSHSAASVAQLVKELNKFRPSFAADDLALCGEILLDPHSPSSRRLLVLQHLMLPVKDCLQRVVSVLLPMVPWLLAPVSAVDGAEGTANDVDDAAAAAAAATSSLPTSSASNEFLEACLDAVFSRSAASAWDAAGMDSCLDQLMRVTIKSRDHWILACRTLVRLSHLGESPSAAAEEEEGGEPGQAGPEAGAAAAPKRKNGVNASVAQVVVQYALVGLEAAGSQLVPVEWILPSLHNDLLPLLRGNVDYLVPLWVHVWTGLAPPQDATRSDERAHHWMLQTSVLCAVLPDLVHTSHVRLFLEQAGPPPRAAATGVVPVPADEDEDDIGDGSLPPLARGRPVQSPVLWNLIHACLMQGLYVERKRSWIQESWARESSAEGGAAQRLPFGTCQLLRRRGLYLLGVLVEGSSGYLEDHVVTLWRKYAMCCETTEMESTPHLIDQVWDTMGEIGAQLVVDDSPAGSASKCPPPLSWTWMYPLLARVITSYEAPSLRKLCLYRLFQGQAGILLRPQPPGEADYASRQKKPSKKSRTGNRPSQATAGTKGASIKVITPDFILDIVFPSFDTLESASGSQMHVEEDRKEVRHDMYQLLGAFLDAYLRTVDDGKCEALFRGLWSKNVLGKLSRKTTVAVFAAVAASLKRLPGFRIPTHRDMYALMTASLKDFFSLGSVIPAQRESILESMAVMLSRCHSATIEPLPPPVMLTILALFPVTPREKPLELIDDAPVDERLEDFNHFQAWLEQDPIFGFLRQWISNVCGSNRAGWTSTTGGAIATAFVDGVLLPSSTSSLSWDPNVGCSPVERELGQAVALFCTLACTFESETAAGTTPASLLWPAIHKGLTSNVTMLLASKAMWIKADVISRAIILMENGCTLRVISGLGNGDIVIDRKTQEILSPPQNVETLVGLAVAFLVHHFRHLFRPKPNDSKLESSVLLGTFINLMSQLETLHKGYPSSTSIHQEVNALLNDTLTKLPKRETSTATDAVVCVSTVYATLACGGVLWGPDLLKYCKDLLHMQFSDFEERSASSMECKAYRCVFSYAKWASIAKLLPRTFESMSWMEIDSFVDGLVEEAVESVPTAPQEALVSIFHCVLIATKFGLEPSRERAQLSSDENVSHVERLIRSIVRVMKECKGSGNVAHMLDQAASLLFRPELLTDEAERFLSDPDSKMPLLDAFREFVKLAGTKRHHILEAVLCRISVGWLGPSNQRDNMGIAAIPYLKEIARLLIYKEEKLDATAMGHTDWRKERSGDFTSVPSGTHESSVARGFVLLFLSRLNDIDKGLSPRVLSGFLRPLIQRLLEEVKPLKNVSVSLGSGDFIRKIRGWQALCVLSRFVDAETAPLVCAKVFEAMEEILHNQIRYFMEVFSIQCARRHPAVFGNALVEQITRTDLSMQHVSSLMIVGGNLVVGRYRDDFFRQFKSHEPEGGVTSLDKLLSGILPWLGSTQSFSRAIAQLLVHRLIPMVSDGVDGSGKGESNWYLKSIYNFLERNSEMKRLRSKQVAYFEQYDVDYVCTPKGILTLPVDDGGEAFPPHAVDAMKESLREVFQEANSENTPSWKQLDAISHIPEETTSEGHPTNSVINVQRKIIPIDALNLALEDFKDMRQRNRAGRKKQKLIVCATFIDKVPNLGGLSRTAEIFAAEKLVVPDLRVLKTDSFKSLSVAAGDWIDIEECREENLLSWLRDRKQNGYFIVGLEQTASSVSLCDFRFPDQPIVLLLGKEKEGIPVEFLQVVDQCVEIPQLGICRSLNVHVSGAVAIWEQTRQRIANGTLVDPSHET